MSDDVGTPELRRRKMHSMRQLLHLEVQDLRDLAEVILRRDVDSLKPLTDDEVKRMLDALEGAEKVIFLLGARRSG